MSVRHLGSKTVGALALGVTLALPAVAKYVADLLSRRAELVGRLDTYVSLGVALVDPTTIAAQLAAALAAFPAQLATIAAGALPSVGAAKASVDVELAALGLGLGEVQTVADTLSAAVSAGGVHAFAVDSTPAAVSTELSALVAGGMPGGGLPSARIRGVILLTEDPAAFEALSKVLLTT